MTPDPPPRRRFRIRLRTLMVLVLIVGAWFGWRLNRAHTQARSVAAIRRSGGEILYDYEFDGTQYMNNSSPPFPAWLRKPIGDEFFREPTYILLRTRGHPEATDDTLAAVGELDRLIELGIYDRRRITDFGLAHLAGLRRLRELRLWFLPRVTDEGLAHLAGLRRLRVFSIRSLPRITDAGLALLAGMSELRELELVDCDGITDAGLRARVARLTGLRKLTLNGPGFTGAGLACLEPLKDLQWLDLMSYGTDTEGLVHEIDKGEPTDDDLAHLSGLTELTHLNLYFSPRITGAGLRHLRGLKKLRKLILFENRVSDEAIDELKAAIPGLTVSRDGGFSFR